MGTARLNCVVYQLGVSLCQLWQSSSNIKFSLGMETKTYVMFASDIPPRKFLNVEIGVSAEHAPHLADAVANEDLSVVTTTE